MGWHNDRAAALRFTNIFQMGRDCLAVPFISIVKKSADVHTVYKGHYQKTKVTAS